jgi:holo-[acyl-carrier protein] synthase
MIHGIGTDLVDVRRVRDGLARFGERYAERILAGAECTAYRASRDPARFLAKSFAAKEAFAKAAGTGLRAPVTLHNLAVLRNAQGRPHFACMPELSGWLAAQGIAAHHLSLSDEGEFVLAWAVLEKT